MRNILLSYKILQLSGMIAYYMASSEMRSSINMKMSYNKLWKLLIDKNMKKSDLRKNAGISSSSLAKLGKDENVTTEVLMKICNKLNCDVGDIMKINNRRYTGSKYKLMTWIKKLILENCTEHDSVFDVFGGTGVVTSELLDITQENIINDFLYSNEIFYKAFFSQKYFDAEKLKKYEETYNNINRNVLDDNYVSENYGDKYFKMIDAKLIGFIRADIEQAYTSGDLNEKERNILLASLLYSFDRCANTVGHYEAYIKGKEIRSDFTFELIEPIETSNTIRIFREDSNALAKKIIADIAFIDPPYNSRQYSRFYHVLETIVKWDKPQLVGAAMKPPEENMSDYCRKSAPAVFEELIKNLKVKYIVVTYNNTYDSKSSSSKNKITLEQIKSILEKRGKTKIFETSYHRFNAGKTAASNHKELVFITDVGTHDE